MPKPIAGRAVCHYASSENFSKLSCDHYPRKQWRRDHPFGFFAKPARTQQGILDLKKWECGVPGKDKTLWEGGLFKLDVLFPDGSIPSTF